MQCSDEFHCVRPVQVDCCNAITHCDKFPTHYLCVSLWWWWVDEIPCRDGVAAEGAGGLVTHNHLLNAPEEGRKEMRDGVKRSGQSGAFTACIQD